MGNYMQYFYSTTLLYSHLRTKCENQILDGNAGLVMSVAKCYFGKLRRSVYGGESNGVGSMLTMQDMIQESNLLVRWKLRHATTWRRR